MDQRIQPGNPKQRLRAQPAKAEWPLFHHSKAKGALVPKAGQQQRVDPKHKAQAQPGQGTGPRGPAPKQPADKRGQNLCDPGKGNQPDGRQSSAPTRQTKIEVAQHQDHCDGHPTRHQHNLAHVARDRHLLACACGQVDRHHQMVRHHHRQRHCRHNHHGRGR